MSKGYECGISLNGYNDIKVDDIFEAYVMEEIQRLLTNYNEQSNKPYSLHISYGIAAYTEASSVTEEALKHQADQLMYQMKISHRRDKGSDNCTAL